MDVWDDLRRAALSKRVWVAVLAAIAILLSEAFGFDETTLNQIIALVVALIVGDSVGAINPTKARRPVELYTMKQMEE
jgi:hypothetical protein